ncbi:MAG: hypothetical protein JNM09_26900 [Blastocatellia bacterium]|nr:hypothetical protein [Blastocatellia bacterium]
MAARQMVEATILPDCLVIWVIAFPACPFAQSKTSFAKEAVTRFDLFHLPLQQQVAFQIKISIKVRFFRVKWGFSRSCQMISRAGIFPSGGLAAS